MENDIKGFTLIELLAVIVILAIVISISVPIILNLIKKSTKLTFESNAKMILQSVSYELIKNENFDVSTITKENISNFVKVNNDNYESVTIEKIDNKPYLILVGKNKWDNLVVHGTSENIIVEEGLALFMNAKIQNAMIKNEQSKIVWKDLSASGNDGELINYGSNEIWENDVINFNGSTNYVNIPGNTILEPKNITISAWIKMDEDASKLRHIFLTKWYGYSCEISATTRTPYFRLHGIGDVYSSENIIPSKWYNFVGTFEEGVGSKIYLNGVLRGTHLTTGAISYTKNSVLNIGRWSGGVYFKGNIREVKIYNRALIENEIADNYNREKVVFGF